MQLQTISDLSNYHRTEVEAFVHGISPLRELEDWLETRNDPEMELKYQIVQRERAARAALYEPTLRSTFRIEPSSIHQCVRKLWYQLMGTEKHEHIDPGLRRIFDTGHAMHEQLQTYFECMWGRDEFVDEVNIMIEDLFLSGHTDGKRTTSQFRFLLEFKTINHDGFTKLGGKPKKEHPQQFHCYMKAEDVPLGFIIYMDKNNSMMSEFPIIFSQPLWNSLEARCLNAIETDEDGPTSDPASRFVCATCAYTWTCPQKLGRY